MLCQYINPDFWSTLFKCLYYPPEFLSRDLCRTWIRSRVSYAIVERLIACVYTWTAIRTLTNDAYATQAKERLVPYANESCRLAS